MVEIENEPLIDEATLCRELKITQAKLQQLVHLGAITPAITRGGVRRFWLSAVRRDIRLNNVFIRESRAQYEH